MALLVQAYLKVEVARELLLRRRDRKSTSFAFPARLVQEEDKLVAGHAVAAEILNVLLRVLHSAVYLGIPQHLPRCVQVVITADRPDIKTRRHRAEQVPRRLH